MHMSLDALTERLVRENDEFRRLFEKHRNFEAQLEKLNARLVLNDEERFEAINLKKQKLALKDRMAAIARELVPRARHSI